MDERKKKELMRTLGRATENIGAVKAEFYLVGKVKSALILAFAAVMIAGLVAQMALDPPYSYIGTAFVLAGALAILGVYAASRARGPLNFTVVYYRGKQGEESTLQILGKKHMYFAGKGGVLRLDKDRVEKCDGLYRPDLRWDWFRSAEFDDCRESARETKYIGRFSGRAASLSLRGGTVEYGEAVGVRMRYADVNNLKSKVFVPEKLYAVILAQGYSESELPFVAPMTRE